MKNRQYYLWLLGAIALGSVLRFWHLNLKPLWMDEVITAIFSLGKNYHDLPLNVVFPLNRVHEIFTFKSGVSCREIAGNLASQSTHPPLFFCGMYRWLSWLTPLGNDWVTKLRSLPALFGVGAILAIYGVNRIAFSPTSGILAAFLMAVSPFAVYLSQEARHYTLPMFLITLSLLGFMQIQQDIVKGHIRFWVWCLWGVINILGFYVHYFFILAFIAEIATLLIVTYWDKSQLLSKPQICLALIISTASVIICFFPWIVVTISHAQRSETNWLPSTIIIATFYQTLINWILMIIALPVENQSLIITIISGLLMLSFTIWAGLIIFKGLKQLCSQDTTRLATLTLIIFTGLVLLQYFTIAYVFGKDITAIPRYSFVYYPSFCALFAASIVKSQKVKTHQPKIIIFFIFVGLLSSILVVFNLVFQKPFQPEKVAENINFEPSIPVMLVVTYENYQDVALGLSFALRLEKIRSQKSEFDSFVALNRTSGLSVVWEKLSQLSTSFTSRLNLWIVAPGLRRRDYPEKLALSQQINCIIDPKQHYRIGIPYQMYRCGK